MSDENRVSMVPSPKTKTETETRGFQDQDQDSEVQDRDQDSSLKNSKSVNLCWMNAVRTDKHIACS